MENYPQLLPLVIFAPLIGLLINLFFGRFLGERGVSFVAVGAALTAFAVALLQWSALVNLGYEPFVVELPLLPTWIGIPSAAVDIAWQFRVDTLSVLMMLIVSGIGSLIHIYATGYMHGDPLYPRFFVYLNLFLVFMLLLVTGNNFLVMFVGWEGVGLCSYLLIGFWWDKTQRDPQFGTVGWRNSIAARKAMIVNRVGDFGILIAVFLIFWTFGTLDFYKPGEVPLSGHAAGEDSVEATGEGAEGHAAEAAVPAEGETGVAAGAPRAATMGVFNQAELMIAEGATVQIGPLSLSIELVLTLITLLFLLGVTGKSAQIPLFVWLPDAMAGPTPVSALIHAATMVTAGVYLMVRSNVFFHHAPFSSGTAAVVGALTALVGGFIALGQWDIKKVLAYSTVSQLGFMVAAAGLGAYGAAMFHLLTHAFFKALLFLGSGAVIHGVEHGHHHVAHARGHSDSHEEAEPFDAQDMRNMGGLRVAMPTTYRTYVIGALALAGIFPLAGFWSKDEILADALNVGFLDNRLEGYIAFTLLFVSALFTAFYIWRQVVLIFHGEPRTEAAKYATEESYGMSAMRNVLVALAIGTVLIGFVNVPSGFWVVDWVVPTHALTDFLEHSVVYAHAAGAQLLLAALAVGAGLAMILLAGRTYGKRPLIWRESQPPVTGRDPLATNPSTAGVFALSNARLSWDETYDRVFVVPFGRAARWLAEKLDWAFWHDFFHNTILYDTFQGVTRVLTRPVDLGIIDGAVNGTGRLLQRAAGRLRRIQTGYVRSYAFTLLLGAMLVILLLLLPVLRQLLGV